MSALVLCAKHKHVICTYSSSCPTQHCSFPRQRKEAFSAQKGLLKALTRLAAVELILHAYKTLRRFFEGRFQAPFTHYTKTHREPCPPYMRLPAPLDPASPACARTLLLPRIILIVLSHKKNSRMCRCRLQSLRVSSR